MNTSKYSTAQEESSRCAPNAGDWQVGDYKTNIPEQLRDFDWYVYNLDANENPKAPRTPRGTKAAWKQGEDDVDFEEAVDFHEKAPNVTHIGAQFPENEEVFYIDLDGAFDVPFDQDSLRDWVPPEFIEHLKSTYTEFSSSGQGLTAVFRGDLPSWWENVDYEDREHVGVEIYEERLCIFTGYVVSDDYSITDSDQATEQCLKDVYTKLSGESPFEKILEEAAENFNDSDDKDTIKNWDDVSNALLEITPNDVDACSTNHVKDRQKDDWETWNPSYRHSKSGRGLARDASTGLFIDWSQGADYSPFGTLDIFAAEKGWLDKPWEPLTGETWVNAYQSLREYVPDLPELDFQEEEKDGFQIQNPTSYSFDKLVEFYEEAGSRAEKRKVTAGIAEKLVLEDNWATTRETDILRHYQQESGIYTQYGESDLREILTQSMAHHYTTHRHSQIEEMLRGRSTISKEKFGGKAGLIPVKNGVIDVETNELREHKPEYYHITRAEVAYNPGACSEPEVFLEYLKDAVPNENDRKKLQEFAGYCLVHWDIPWQKALFIVGPTNSGKSVFLDVLEALVGSDVVSSLSPSQLTNERFSTAQLEGTWVNIRNDIPAETVTNEGLFKELVSGESMKAERKGKPLFDLSPNAKHVFAGNQVPKVAVDDDAFFDRILLVPMPLTVPREEQNPHLTDEILDNKPALLNWALDGLHRLRQQNGFTNDRSVLQTEKLWHRWGSSIKRFIAQCIEITGEEADTVDKKLAHELFVEFCELEGMPRANQRTLTDTLKQYAGVNHTGYGGQDGRGYYEGIALSEVGWKLSDYLEGEIDDETIEELIQRPSS